MIKRTIEERIESHLFQGRVIQLWGARHTGKTTLVKALLTRRAGKRTRYLNCDSPAVQQALAIQDAEPLKAYLGNYELIVLDEAQNVSDIAMVLKILVDTYPEMQIVATGSSAFDLAAKTMGAPLTGRVYRFELHPLSLQELAGNNGYSVIEHRLESILRFGLYPEMLDLSEAEVKVQLDELILSHLYKDLFTYVGIKRSDVVINLLRFLALQIGSEVSYTDLGNAVGVDRKTVTTYIDLLEQCFVIFRLRPFSRTLRKEVGKSQKFYFCDLGVRNAILQAFAPLALRSDVGVLWENFCLLERRKFMANQGLYANTYFWRTYDQQEVDYIEERDGVLTGYECKWNPARQMRSPRVFLETYPGSTVHQIDRDSYWRYLL